MLSCPNDDLFCLCDNNFAFKVANFIGVAVVRDRSKATHPISLRLSATQSNHLLFTSNDFLIRRSSFVCSVSHLFVHVKQREV